MRGFGHGRGGGSSGLETRKLVVVIHGNSVARGEGASAGHQPSDMVTSLLAARGITASVFNEAVNGQDIDYYITNFSTQVHQHYDSTRANIVLILEDSDYIDDTRGAAGDSLSLTNPSAAGLANYNKFVSYAQTAHALTTSNQPPWLVIAVCAPACNEPSTYATSGDNTNYQNACEASNDLKRLDRANFYRISDARRIWQFSPPFDTTIYQNAPNGERIHLQDLGYDTLGVCFFNTIIGG